jgi:hypothetical protein
MVRMKGLEPSRLSALAPKTSVSTIPPHPLVLPYASISFWLSPKASINGYGRPLKILFIRYRSLDYDFDWAQLATVLFYWIRR